MADVSSPERVCAAARSAPLPLDGPGLGQAGLGVGFRLHVHVWAEWCRELLKPPILVWTSFSSASKVGGSGFTSLRGPLHPWASAVQYPISLQHLRARMHAKMCRGGCFARWRSESRLFYVSSPLRGHRALHVRRGVAGERARRS